MSTTPGEHTWADAGLVPPDSSEVPPAERTTVPREPGDLPAAPRPDLRDEAAEHDLLEQQQDLAGASDEAPRIPDDAPEGDVLEQHREAGSGDEPTGPPSARRDDAAEHDVLEQSQAVPEDDDDYPVG